MSDPRHVVLVGLPGVGKTSVGREVAAGLGRPFVDLDVEIERSFGMPVAEIFDRFGEAGFREAEAAASERVARDAPKVVAPGGGWILNDPAVAYLRPASRIIYLRVTPAEAIRRMGKGIAKRPLLAGDDAAGRLKTTYQARREAYERQSDMTVETSGLRRESVAERVLGLVRAAERDFIIDTD